ncbi:Coq4 family protein [Sphingobacterium deserti]|uniref:Coenzyme Q (Ubiquinone) biosynthesis protein Coq4 n=1 Tax=Sphingobacterium deserti TaxID=1229276 RepID=A0A0B8T3J8_9SPHI|nr:Coq4 family protein [Sphingobacterium deserti]KGE13653.1 hypothetical protein DI53_2574 [Sphingobacterium deserti]
MKDIRLQIMLWLYEGSSSLYATIFKFRKKAWGITKEEFMTYGSGTLGEALGHFYFKNGFDVMPKLENHDVFHVLTHTGTTIQEEIAMQYLLLGNGKISLYLLGMITIGTFFYPECYRLFKDAFVKGKNSQSFHRFEFQNLLEQPLDLLQSVLINNKISIIYK